MSVTTRFYNGSSLVATVSEEVVTIVFDASGTPVLKYDGNVIDQVQSDAGSGHDSLTIKVTNGGGWPIKDVKAKMSNTAAEERLNLALDNSGWAVVAWYPTTSPHTASWLLSDLDGPEVTLKVVVKRV